MMQLLLICFFIFCISNESCAQETIPTSTKEEILNFIKAKQIQRDSTRVKQDSMCIIPLNDPSLFMIQTFYGSGIGNGITNDLVRKNQTTMTLLDSLFWYNADDLYKPQTSVYNDSLNWFYYAQEGGGIGHYSEYKNFIRVENDQFVTLLSFPRYISSIDIESKPFTLDEFETEEILLSQQEIILKATYTKSKGRRLTRFKVLRTAVDTVTFVYSTERKCFVWKNSTNKLFEKIWLGEIDYFQL